MTLFVVVGALLTLIAVGIPLFILLRSGDDDVSPVVATGLALTIPAAVVAIYLSVSNHDWQAPTPAATASAPPTDMQSAVASLQEKLRANPDDIDGWILLGNAQLQQQQFADARAAFENALGLHDDRRARLGLAEVTVLEDQNALTGPAGRVFEAVLEDEPLNPKALFYAGMAALAREENDLVRKRWGRLLELSPPDNIRRILEQQIDLLEPTGAPRSSADLAADTSIAVTIDLAPAVKAQVNSGDSLFLLARVPNRPGPPIAAVRINVTEFPLTTQLSDANAMLPGRSLTDADELEIVARVSKNGDAISQPGDIFGDVVFLWGSQVNEAVVVLDRVVEGS